MATTISTTRTKTTTSPGLNAFLWILRIVVGLLFIFSGVVKANDPSGLANKMIEFFDLWDMHSFAEHALLLSVLMIGFEIIAGVSVLLGFRFKIFSFLLLLLNLFFTFLTAYVYYWDVIMHNPKVRECGCFGDCIKISNSETFWKDVVLTILVLILFVFRKHVKGLFPKVPNLVLMLLTVLFAFGVQWYRLQHLPFYDCMPYKVGNSICEKKLPPPGGTPDSFAMVFQYKYLPENKVYDIVSMDSVGLISGDTTGNWEFVDRVDKLMRKGTMQDAEIKDFKIAGEDGTDYTDAVLTDPSYKFLLFLREPMEASTTHLAELKALYEEAQQKGITCLILSSGLPAENAQWRAKWNIPGEFYTFDGTASKTALRSNPGLMLLKGCIIEGKWAPADYPKNLTQAGIK